MTSAVIFGAGGIGRGFVGELLGLAGWTITFVDVVAPLIERLNADGGYRVIEVDGDAETVVRVTGVRAIALDDAAAVADALAGARLAATAVGVDNLPPVAQRLAEGLEERARRGAGPLDVLVCENLHDAPALLGRLIREATTGQAVGVGLAHTSIGRMVPVQDPGSTDARVEPYGYLPYAATALLNAEPDVPGLVPVREAFDLYADRKLYVHNMGHCLLAYLGEAAGDDLIADAVARPLHRELVRSAMVEAAAALAVAYHVPLGPLLEHVDDLLGRFANRALGDTTARVGRDPERKMHPDDRMLGAYRAARRAQIPAPHLALAVALGAWRLAREPGWDPARAAALVDEALTRDAPVGDDERRLLDDLAARIAAGADVEGLAAALADHRSGRRVV